MSSTHIDFALRDGTEVRALASHQCVPGWIRGTRRHMWVEFVVGVSSLLREVLLLVFRFPPLLKTNISKFQLDLDYCQALYHEPLVRVMAQALPVFDIKFTCTFTFTRSL